ncbi:epoxide hydrolase 3-like [Contarinia nasturtii]|uniref:epoxide hydrolase 3-like n=1 Tax=Contarinia nasturtii TaxID=265458 RepID=UPI0012D4B922|nr:epoxide hydrolase 3-like [Contarinia nasturtii]XP_031628444.1 epoxide hydrolase 3-like [Contarinia nasturtii]
MSFFEILIKFVVIWTLSVLFSIIASVRLILFYITHCASMPWNTKDRILMLPPACLTYPEYGSHKYVTIDKIRLHYVESGDKSKPLMVFVHGQFDFWYSFRSQITEFNKDYWVIAMDLRGFNLSDKPSATSSYKIEHLIDDLKVFIQRLNRKNCILVCHDWGAFIGWDFVAQNNDMVLKYVMLSMPARRIYYNLSLTIWDQLKRSWYFFVSKMPYLPEKLLSTADYDVFFEMRNRKFSENFNEDDLELYKYVFSKKYASTAAINHYRANSSFVSKKEERHDDGSKGMFILGQRDPYISHAAIIMMANKYQKLRVEVIPDANHFVHQDASNATNKLIRDFLGPASNYEVETVLV